MPDPNRIRIASIILAGVGVMALSQTSALANSYGVDELAADAWSAISKPKKDKSYTHDYCKTEGAYCGTIAYANGGGYVVKSVDLHAQSSQPGKVQINPYCASVEKKFSSDLALNQYDVFVVPANCLYTLKINIQSGPKKNRDIMLTPGCVAQTWTDGTIASNEWHKDISWSDQAKQAGASGTVQDPAGNKCSVR